MGCECVQDVENHLGGIGRRAAIIAFRLDVQVRVHVADHDAVGMLLFPAANLIDVGVSRQRTERAEIRRQHTLVRLLHDRQDLIHEQYRRFEQDLGIRLGAFLRQIERIADCVGNVLNIRWRIIMRQNVRVVFLS